MGKISFKVLKEKVTFMRKKLIGTIIIVIVGILIYAWEHYQKCSNLAGDEGIRF